MNISIRKFTKTDLSAMNAVLAANTMAIHLYQKLGFIQLGIIPGGFLSKKNKYLDIIPYYTILS